MAKRLALLANPRLRRGFARQLRGILVTIGPEREDPLRSGHQRRRRALTGYRNGACERANGFGPDPPLSYSVSQVVPQPLRVSTEEVRDHLQLLGIVALA